MPRKYIHIKQLNVRMPFTHSQIHFMIRVKEKQSNPVENEMEMANKVLSISLNQYVKFQHHTEHIDDLALYVIVIGGCDRVVCIGYICLDLQEEVRQKKSQLKGVAKQNGYLIHSIRDDPYPEQMSLQSVMQNKKKIKARSQIITKNIDLPQNTNKESDDKQQKQTENVFKTQFMNNDQKSSQSVSPVRSQLRKGYDSLIDVYITDNKQISSQNIKSEGHLQSSNKNKHIPYSYLDSSNSKYKNTIQKLALHKQRNNYINSILIELQREFVRQQQKIRDLGIIKNQ